MNHRDQVLGLLKKQIGNSDEVRDISETAKEVANKWVKPLKWGKGRNQRPHLRIDPERKDRRLDRNRRYGRR